MRRSSRSPLAFSLPINVFDFTVSRHRDGPQEILGNFQGTLMADCYSGFESVVLASDARIARAACWSHARRKFVELEAKAPQAAAVMLALMTLVSSAVRNHLDVAMYLKDVLDQLLAGCRDYHSLCPDIWVQTHPQAVRTYRVGERRDAAERKRVRRAGRRLLAT